LEDPTEVAERAFIATGLVRNGSGLYTDKAGHYFDRDRNIIEAGSPEEAEAKVLCGDPFSVEDAAVLGWRFVLRLEGDERREGKINARASNDAAGASQFGATTEICLTRIASWELSRLSRKDAS
jgi:hypothetical protein